MKFPEDKDFVVGNQVVGNIVLDPYTTEEANSVATENKYVKSIFNRSNLHVLKTNEVVRSFQERGLLGHFFCS